MLRPRRAARVLRGWVRYACGTSLPTHTGLDLPDGSYRVTPLAHGPNGRITHVEEISFP